MKPITVIYRKLGQHNNATHSVEGLAWKEDRIAEVDMKLKGFDKFHALIHELIHVQNPTWNEIKVKGHAKQLAEILWEQGYRQIDL